MTSINANIPRKGRNHKLAERYARGTDLHKHFGSFENEALENEDQGTKHSNLENEAPVENEALEKEALKLETTVGWITTILRLAWRNPNQVEAADAFAPPKVDKIHPKVL